MQTKIKQKSIIGTRDFIRDFSNISNKPKSKKYIIVKYGEPIGTFTPWQDEEESEWWKSLENAPEAKEAKEDDKKRITLKDLEKYRFSGPKDLSQRVDEIVYGVKK